MVTKFYVGELVLYQNGDNFEIGKIKRFTDDGCAFIWYSSGETAAKTSLADIHKIVNRSVITETSLGGMSAKEIQQC